MEQIKRMIRSNEIGRRITDQFYLDEDLNVPDSKCDARRVVFGEGRVKVDEMKPVERYIKVSGRLDYQILYEAEGEAEKLVSLQGKLPFEEMVYMEEEPAGQFFVKSCEAELTVTLIHSRKVNMKAEITMEIGSEGEQERFITEDVEEEALYKKFRPLDLLKLHAVKKDVYRIKEEMRIPGTKENIGELLYKDVELRKLDTRLGEETLTLRGELQVFCLYESQDGKADWTEQSVPFEGTLECPGAEDGMYHYVYAELTDDNMEARMDEDGEMRILGMEASLEVRYTVYEEEQVKILEDVYSINKDLAVEKEEMMLESLVMQNQSRCKLTEQMTLPELKEGALQICHTSGFMQMEAVQIVPGGLQVEGLLNLSFLYIKADDEKPFDVWRGMVPFTHLIEAPYTEPEMRYDISGTLEQLSISLMGSGETEIRAALSFRVFLRRPEKIRNICGMQMEPLDPKEIENAPGMVGYIVKEGDTLWDIAKRYRTSEESIRKANGTEEGGPKPGDRILIFKENMSIL